MGFILLNGKADIGINVKEFSKPHLWSGSPHRKISFLFFFHCHEAASSFIKVYIQRILEYIFCYFFRTSLWDVQGNDKSLLRTTAFSVSINKWRQVLWCCFSCGDLEFKH